MVAVLLLASCSDKEISGPVNDPAFSGGTNLADGMIVMTINVNGPDTRGTRSETESDGSSSGDKNNQTPTLDGTANEGSIDTATINFFAAEDYTDFNEGALLLSLTDFTFDGNFLKKEIRASQLANLAGKKVKIFIVANCAAEISDPFSSNFGATTIEDDPLGNNLYDSDNTLVGKKVPIAIQYEYIVDMTALEGATDSEILTSLSGLVGYGYNEASRTLNLSQVIDPDNDKSKPVDTVDLERCVARADFKPNSGKDVDGNTQLPLNIYRVGEIENLYAKMNTLQIINVSKDAFVFRHTSQGNATVGQKDDAEPKLFGVENFNDIFGTPKPDDYVGSEDEWGNIASKFTWIADTDWSDKETWAEGNDTDYNNGGAYTTDASGVKKYNYFLNQPTKETGDPIYYVHPDENEKLHGVLEVEGLEANKYKAWCYMMENTLPSTDAMINGLSTGIAFNMFLCHKDGTPLVYNDANEDLSDFISQETYRDNQVEYENACNRWLEDYQKWVAKEENKNKSKDEYKAVNEYPVNKNEGKVAMSSIEPYKYRENNVEKTSDDFYKITIGEAVTYAKKTKVKINVSTENGEGETVTTTEERDAFVITYYYYFRHNISKNHVLGTIEPMQFAVVRNNIYKVSVTSLNGLPEPYDPKKSDEPVENYISVELNILSWAVEDRVVDL